MRLLAVCTKCRGSLELLFADYFEDGVAEFECSKGHKSVYIVQAQKFEMLLESAANAIIDGYTLEAASSFYSAYERFLEFFIRVICDKRGVKPDSFKKTFKQISRQSERQVGAFLFLYLLEFEKPYKLNDKITEFRNKVIHKGYIPTPKEAEDFGGKVYAEIYALTQLLKKNYSDNISLVMAEDYKRRDSSCQTDVPRVSASGPFFFSFAHTAKVKNFNEAFAKYKEIREQLKLVVPSNVIKT